MSSSHQNADSSLMSALIACLDGMMASDAVPEGLMRGEIGWLGDGMSDPQRESAGVRAAQNRNEALNLANTARGLLSALAIAGEIPADSALQLDRALDDAVVRIGAAMRQAQTDRIRGLYVIIDPEVTGGRDPLDIARAAGQAAGQGRTTAPGNGVARPVRREWGIVDHQ